MENDIIRHRLVNVTALASEYCAVMESCVQMEKDDFVKSILSLLPRIYFEFSDISAEDVVTIEEFQYFPSYVDEDFYESIRRNAERVLGPDDTFLETFEEDMKYSDTPIAASVSELLADIFQPLYNFVSVVRESEGSDIIEAFSECKENFESYWAQTLCNVMRPLNNLRYER